MSNVWDAYIESVKKHGQVGVGGVWPGDQWGDRQLWSEWFESMIVSKVKEKEALKFVEIGPGSGKYTLKILEKYPTSAVRAYDISAQYLEVMNIRCADYITKGRLSSFVITEDAYCMRNDLISIGWMKKVDCLCSFDAMVHVDLQYLMAYLLTAAQTLVPGGVLSMSLASPTNPAGFSRLFNMVKDFFPYQGKPSQKLEWVSPDTMVYVLEQLGFENIETPIYKNGDLLLTASLKEAVFPNW